MYNKCRKNITENNTESTAIIHTRIDEQRVGADRYGNGIFFFTRAQSELCSTSFHCNTVNYGKYFKNGADDSRYEFIPAVVTLGLVRGE